MDKILRNKKAIFIFIAPALIMFVLVLVIPMVQMVYYSLCDYAALTPPKFTGLANYKKLFSDGDIWVYAKNTMVMWIMCFIPQIFLSLLLGAWFSDVSLKLKGQRFYHSAGDRPWFCSYAYQY